MIIRCIADCESHEIWGIGSLFLNWAHLVIVKSGVLDYPFMRVVYKDGEWSASTFEAQNELLWAILKIALIGIIYYVYIFGKPSLTYISACKSSGKNKLNRPFTPKCSHSSQTPCTSPAGFSVLRDLIHLTVRTIIKPCSYCKRLIILAPCIQKFMYYRLQRVIHSVLVCRVVLRLRHQTAIDAARWKKGFEVCSPVLETYG